MFWEKLFNRAYDKDTIDKIKFLSNIYIFKGIRKKDLLYILENLYEKKYQKNEFLFKKGDLGKALFIIYRGKIGLYKSTDLSKFIIEVKEGEFFGEMALLEEMPRTMTAVALEDTDVFMLYRISLENMIKTKPKISSLISYNLACVLSSRIRNLIENEQRD